MCFPKGCDDKGVGVGGFAGGSQTYSVLTVGENYGLVKKISFEESTQVCKTNKKGDKFAYVVGSLTRGNT